LRENSAAAGPGRAVILIKQSQEITDGRLKDRKGFSGTPSSYGYEKRGGSVATDEMPRIMLLRLTTVNSYLR
jgi:hypothetical protein